MKFFFLLLLLTPATAFADQHSLSSDTVLGKDYFSDTIGYQGYTANKSASEWKWNVNYTLSQSTTQSGNTTLTDKTHDFTGGAGWRGWNALDLGLGLDLSLTPSEALNSFGGTLSAAYTLRFGGTREKNSEEQDETSSSFHPSVGAGLSAGRMTYQQGQRPVRRQSGKAQLASTISVEQIQTSLNLFGSPFEWLYLKLGITRYRYDRNVATFVSNLESAAPLSGITGAASGFLSSSRDWMVSVYPFDDWSLDFSGSNGISAVDESISRDIKLIVGWDASDRWHFGLGAQRYLSSSLTQTTLYFNLAYHFD